MVEMLNVTYGQSGASTNQLGQRPMQSRCYAARSAQYILLKAPPAAGKSRALMYIALDKMHHQGIEKTIICVPETTIGGSFRSTDLRSSGFEFDWVVEDRWNLCLVSEDADDQKVKAFVAFLASDAKVLVCTHATFRFGFEAIEASTGVGAFDACFIGIDEFHHVSASDNNRLGVILRQLMMQDQSHIMAMTGSYFRGDADPVLRLEDEARFTTITYSYYEQLESYQFLKALGINYEFYKGNYLNGLSGVLDGSLKTIIHIPHRGSSEALDDKLNEVGLIMDFLGKHVGEETETGFDLVRTPEGRTLKIADLVNDGPARDTVKASLAREIKGKDGKRDDVSDRAKVDVIIALGMAKEGFDWIWCEHALTIGYRSSLTEIVQIIGRATRDAPGKSRAIFTNLVAEPGVETSTVTDAVNDMLKAISGSLLMEQVLAPNFKFYRREDDDVRDNISVDTGGVVTIGIKGLIEPPTERAREICEEDMHDLIATACQTVDKRVIADDTAPEVASQLLLTGIIEKRYKNLNEEETESIRQHLAAHMNVLVLARQEEKKLGKKATTMLSPAEDAPGGTAQTAGQPRPRGGQGYNDDGGSSPNTLLAMVKKFINVRDLDVELIDSVNAFRERFEVASKSLDAVLLAHVQSAMVAMRIQMTEDEAKTLWPRIKAFRAATGKEPNVHSPDALERRMGEAHAWLKSQKAKKLRDGTI
ncbi:DEAD/DEAH box helicase [Methylobacterium durans]|uniref:DEAD/DEAH box helicase n=1 Tax=Methylobacterium durans TaxID=2202825 RepID=UPI002AFF80A1|nr:DEAD/DEAH box helicase [Methylobacterium durans]MEA1830936.1 DEAD/DEAH box helicase [Methylobacterium durans]